MGEARRRKKLDSNYGKLPSLKISGGRDRHINKILDDLYSQCESELKTLINAKKTPDNYQLLRDSIAGCLENIMSKYREEDREIIAHYIVSVFSTMSENYNLNPIGVLCLVEILKSYLPSLYEKVKSTLKNPPREFSDLSDELKKIILIS